jgi:SAM-dependent methyltransferase
MGYTSEELASSPEGADLGLGCGNPQAIAALRPGETVLDLGSGGGLDCFLAANQVGASGKVIGVDMTPEMVARARENALKGHFDNVEFRLGEIEHLPVADRGVDVILSNCVINLSTEKLRVFQEAFRVLKPGGRLAISDVVATAEIPAEIRQDPELFSACVAGAATVSQLAALLEEAGFSEIRIQPKDESREFIREWAPGLRIEDYIASATIEARKAAA